MTEFKFKLFSFFSKDNSASTLFIVFMNLLSSEQYKEGDIIKYNSFKLIFFKK